MALRIAFDMDGVLADMESELVFHAESLFGSAVRAPAAAPPDVPLPAPTDAAAAPSAEAAEPETPAVTKLRLTARQQRLLWRHVGSIENFWGGLKEIEPGSVTKLATLAAERRWEVIFLTKRPPTAGATSQLQTQRWLEAHGFPLPSVFVVQGSRGKIAAALGLDFVIDDRPENCLDVVVDSKARAILVWRDDTNKVPATANRLGIGVVSSVGACLNILAEADAPEANRPGVMERVLRLLGLKSTAPAQA
jgi:hypothetical protein